MQSGLIQSKSPPKIRSTSGTVATSRHGNAADPMTIRTQRVVMRNFTTILILGIHQRDSLAQGVTVRAGVIGTVCSGIAVCHTIGITKRVEENCSNVSDSVSLTIKPNSRLMTRPYRMKQRLHWYQTRTVLRYMIATLPPYILQSVGKYSNDHGKIEPHGT